MNYGRRVAGTRVTNKFEMSGRCEGRVRTKGLVSLPEASREQACLYLFVLRLYNWQTLISQLTNGRTDSIDCTQQTPNMASRPTVNVRSTSGGKLFIFYLFIPQFTCYPEASSSLPLPAVLTAPIRLDVVQQVHSTCKTLNSLRRALNV